MTSGGRRTTSGRRPDPNSERSRKRGYKLTALPAEGRPGRAPAFPLPKADRARVVVVDGKRTKEPDARAATALRKRELEIWREYWRTPQACAWEQQTWRSRTVAMVCRLEAIVESEPDSNAALIAQLHRYRDQVGLTPDGLKANGWAIAEPQVTRPQLVPDAPERQRPVRRLRAPLPEPTPLHPQEDVS